MTPPLRTATLFLLMYAVWGANGKIGGWDPTSQYHIQTDEGPERYFKYQTATGQYRKEKRLEDGTVVGSYGWVDANGLLRLRDYIADDKGYRIVRSRMMRVGQGARIDEVVASAKKQQQQQPQTTTSLPPISLSDFLKEQNTPQVQVAPNSYPTSTPRPSYVPPVTFRPYYNPNEIDSDPPYYDGVAFTHNGFKYYLSRHYHEEKSSGDQRTGSFGYIDPFGIRRVIYYNTSPGSGFTHRKNNRYVGFNATPYDSSY